MATVFAALVFLLVSFVPRQSRADVTDSLIISGAVAGGVAAILLIAILLAPRDEDPDFLELTRSRADGAPTATRPRLRFGTACRMPDGTVATVCW